MRIRVGREMMARHRELLAEISDNYGVPPRIIVAIWGVESDYGRLSGIRPTIAALATLAWDPRRSTFFRGELFNALDSARPHLTVEPEIWLHGEADANFPRVDRAVDGLSGDELADDAV